MNKCIIYDVLDLDMSLLSRAVFKFVNQIELQGIVKTTPDSHANSSVLIFIYGHCFLDLMQVTPAQSNYEV